MPCAWSMPTTPSAVMSTGSATTTWRGAWGSGAMVPRGSVSVAEGCGVACRLGVAAAGRCTVVALAGGGIVAIAAAGVGRLSVAVCVRLAVRGAVAAGLPVMPFAGVVIFLAGVRPAVRSPGALAIPLPLTLALAVGSAVAIPMARRAGG